MGKKKKEQKGQAVFDRVSLSVRHATAKHSTRYALHGILLEPGGRTVATDGTILMGVDPSTEEAAPDTKAMRSAMSEPLIMPGNMVDLVRKALPKFGTPVDQLFTVQVKGKQHEAVMTSSRHTFQPEEGAFPPYADVMPNGKPVLSIRLGVPQLERVLKVLKEAGADSFIMQLHGPTKPVKITATVDGSRKVWGVMVPRAE